MHSNKGINILPKAYFSINLYSIIIFSSFKCLRYLLTVWSRNQKFKTEIRGWFSAIITILYFVNHFELYEMHVFNFFSFKLLVFIVIATAFQKANNFYRLGSFNHWFSIWKSFLDARKKIILVPLQKLASFLDYKMTVEVDCPLITVPSGGLFKSLLLKIVQIKIYLLLPILPIKHSQSIPHFWGISFVFIWIEIL